MDETQVAAGGAGIGTLIMYVVIFAVMGFLMGKVFEKAGKPLWAGFVPIYNLIILLEIVGRPIWWIVLFLIPCVNIVAIVLVAMDLAERFGKTKAWGVIFLVLISMVGRTDRLFGFLHFYLSRLPAAQAFPPRFHALCPREFSVRRF
jgi:Family of unknown function (DUF5684)